MFGDVRLPARFWAKVEVDASGCWLWTGSLTASGGYAQLKGPGGRGPVRAHRFAYEALVAPIPDGLVLDHLCRVRRCVNPAHLEAVTIGENTRRGDNVQREKAHCPRGHAYDEANTLLRDGRRNCRTCIRTVYEPRRRSRPINTQHTARRNAR